MEQLPQRFHKTYAPLVLWLDDLERIVARLSAPGSPTKIQTDEHRFESLDELANHFGVLRPGNLTLSRRQPYAEVEFGPRESRIFVSGGTDDAPAATALFHDIDQILTQRQRRFPFLYSYWTIWAVAGVSFASGQFADLSKPPWYVISTALSAVMLAWVCWVAYVRLTRSAVIRLERKTAARSFFQRNRDTLLIGLIGAIIGAFLAVVFPRVAEHLWPKSPTPTQSAPTQQQ